MHNPLVRVSRALCEIEDMVERVARSNAHVLITGETGVGKDIVARLIHRHSQRHGPFVPINCAGVPDSLLESELFGHVRGAFTDAIRDQRGWLDRAANGTIFLDEVGEMSLRMQALLLRFAENGEIQRVGSDRVRAAIDVRIVAATNRNLLERVAQREFREDLYYRLNVIHIVIPPLRERPDDIPPLLSHFLDTFSAEYQVARPAPSDEALARLVAYSWPGNVRELCNIVERLVVRDRDGVISPEDLPPEVSTAAPTETSVGRAEPVRPSIEELYGRMIEGGESFWMVVYRPFMSRDLTRDEVRALVARGLEYTRGSCKGLLRLFNMPEYDYKRLLNFLRKHNCQLPFQEFRAVPLSSALVSQSVDRSGLAPTSYER